VDDDEGGWVSRDGCGRERDGPSWGYLAGDDLLSGIQAAESDSERNKLWSWYGADFYTRRKNKDTPIVLIGTRWHLGDHMGRLDQAERDGDGEKWERVSLPALAIDNDILGRQPGEALWPEQFPAEELEKIKRQPSTTSRIWSSLYQQNPVVDSGGIIDQTWFKWWKSKDTPESEVRDSVVGHGADGE